MRGTDPDSIREFRRKIIEWGKKNLREYPWRWTRDPYRTLIAEMLLHRTRSEQVIPIYLEFIRRYPDMRALARARFEEIQKVLHSAGLRWRVRLLHEMSRKIMDEFSGEIPRDIRDLKSLPGISDYIASAVRCFAFGYPEPILDTNTVRITGRVFGIEITDSSRRDRKFRDLMSRLVDPERPELFNYSLLDLGKTICKKRNPECRICPLNDICNLCKTF